MPTPLGDERFVLPSPPKPEPTELKPHRLTVLLSAAAVCISLLAAGGALHQGLESRRSREAAERSAAAAEKSATEAESLNRISIQTLEIAKDATAAALRAAAAAERQATAAVNQVELTSTANKLAIESLRARVTAIGVTLRNVVTAGEPLAAQIHFHNTGSSEAVDVGIRGRLIIASSLPDGQMPTLEASNPGRGVLAPSGKLSTDITIAGSSINASIVSALKENRARIYVFGVITYNTFGLNHSTEYCFMADPASPKNSLICSKWNSAR